jgi:hypothetical protein
MKIRKMVLHLFICEEQELREKWRNQNQNHPLYERMCQVASTGSRLAVRVPRSNREVTCIRGAMIRIATTKVPFQERALR